MTDQWTHKGLAFGLVPVALDMRNPEEPGVAVRHWAFEPLMDICEGAYGVLVMVRLQMDPLYEPTYPFKITGELGGA